jgi:hypothetical protein
MTVFCTDAEQAGLGWNDWIKADWASVKTAGWRDPIGKKWVRKDDAPSGGGNGPTAGASRIVLLYFMAR